MDEYVSDPHKITVNPGRFEEQMRALARAGLRGVSMRDLLSSRSRARLVGLTFDDGYSDFVTNAVPILQRFGFTATVYVVAGRLALSNEWDRDAPRKRIMNADQARAVELSGMEVGSHTLSHAHLPALEPDEVHREVTESRAILEDVIRSRVTGFAYPYGDVTSREVNAVRAAGYQHASAVKHQPGANGTFAVPRTYIGDVDGPLRLLGKRLHFEYWRARGTTWRRSSA
ncbi:polysaccharide deacetylase family protein [Actinomycetospora straminea]|uniref:polysaccharide deacetylase family protein n=1 Tax=Actinomycetospora straminea TaxID=663607 RepID=UPI002365793E|nr:polysaccharide deacetylase family protein [Actinomycetospora straminea]MDD7931031.1 polysaccharide deacetylase family protein [Actinomycetospora straminea]